MAEVGADIGGVAGVIVPAQIVAPIAAALGSQIELAIETAHGIAAADGDFVLRHQRRAAPLRAKGSVVGEHLFAEGER